MSSLVSQAIANRIKTVSPTAFTHVKRALNVNNIIGNPISGNAQAWVIELVGQPDRNQRDIGSAVQFEDVLYAVVIGLKTTNDPTGEKSVVKLDALRLAVRQSLFDWSPDGLDPFILAGNEQLHSEPGAVYWVERFSSKHLIHKDNLL